MLSTASSSHRPRPGCDLNQPSSKRSNTDNGRQRTLLSRRRHALCRLCPGSRRARCLGVRASQAKRPRRRGRASPLWTGPSKRGQTANVGRDRRRGCGICPRVGSDGPGGAGGAVARDGGHGVGAGRDCHEVGAAVGGLCEV